MTTAKRTVSRWTAGYS